MSDSWHSVLLGKMTDFFINGKYLGDFNVAVIVASTLALILLVSAIRNYFLSCENHELHKELKQRRDEVKQKNEEIRVKDDEHKKLLMVNKLLREMVEGDPYKNAKNSNRKVPTSPMGK